MTKKSEVHFTFSVEYIDKSTKFQDFNEEEAGGWDKAILPFVFPYRICLFRGGG